MVEYRTFRESQINIPELMKRINGELDICRELAIIDDEHMDCIKDMIPEIIEMTKYHRISLPLIIIAIFIHDKKELRDMMPIIDKFDTKVDIYQQSYRLLMRFKHFGFVDNVLNYKCGSSLYVCE